LGRWRDNNPYTLLWVGHTDDAVDTYMLKLVHVFNFYDAVTERHEYCTAIAAKALV